MNRYNKQTISGVKELVNEAQRYLGMSTQDSNPLLALMHSLNSRTYAKAAQSVMGTYDINKLSRLDFGELLRACTDKERETLDELIDQYPELNFE